MKRTEYFSFASNEYHYRRIHFYRSFSQVAAETKAYRPYRGTAQSDMDTTVLVGRQALVEFAEKAGYDIDWKNRLLIYRKGAE